MKTQTLCYFPKRPLFQYLHRCNVSLLSSRRINVVPLRYKTPESIKLKSNTIKVKHSVYQDISAKYITARTLDTYQTARLAVTLTIPMVRVLILRWASHLDAFSGYPDRTWLPSVYRWHDNWYTRGMSFSVLSY